MFRNLRHRIEDLLHTTGARFVRVVMAPARFGSWFFAASWKILLDWWENRRFKHLLYGLPALIVFAGAGYLATAASIRSRTDLLDDYVKAGRIANGAKNYEAANLYFQRGVELQPTDHDAMWALCKTAALTGDQAKVLAILKKLSPVDRAVYAPAHLESAELLLRKQPLTLDDIVVAERQLRNVLALVKDEPTAIYYLGEIEFSRGNFPAAAEQFSKIAAIYPQAQLKLAYALKETNQTDLARTWAKDALSFWSRQVAAKPENVEFRLNAADAYTFLEDFQGAVALLLAALDDKAFRDNTELRRGLARIYVLWSNHLEKTDAPGSLQQRFDLVSKAVLADPNDAFVFDAMMDLLQAGGETSEKAHEFLLDNIAQGRTVPLSHLLLGTQALVNLNQSEASFHLQRALELMPEAMVVANNFAWYLAFKDPPELEKALELVQPLVKQYPDNLKILDTRGCILVRMKRYQEGLADLEKSLPVMRTFPDTHAALAEAYEALNHPELASRHRELERVLRANQSQ